MSGNPNKLIAFSYTGSKFSIVDKIEPYIPEHIHKIDLFGGSGAFTLNTPPSEIETINDINGDIINFFKVLRNQPNELIPLLYLTPVSRQEFNEAWETDNMSDLEKARCFYIRTRQAFCSMGAQAKSKGWHLAKTQSRANMCETVSRWRNGIEKLFPVIDRLSQVQLENKDYLKLIKALDFKDAFFYCDPPYVKEARASENDYRFEFTDQDHYNLAEALNQIEGKAMVSGYDCSLMKDLYENRDWYKIKFPITNNNIRKKPVQECIWTNYNPNTLNGQLEFDFDIYKRPDIPVSQPTKTY